MTPEPREMQALFTRYGFVPDPACPPELLASHRRLVYLLLRAFASGPPSGLRPDGPRGPAALLTTVVEWYRRYDELASAQPDQLAFMSEAGQVRLRLACSVGCNHCCHSPVSVIGPEAVLIGEYIKASLGPEQRAALATRVAAHQAAVADDRDRHALCPLNVEGKCSVYPVRPLNCRKFHSFDEGACRRKFREDDRSAEIPRAAVRGDASGLVWQSVVAAFRVLGVDTRELDFIPALTLALHGERVAARVVAGEPVFAAAGR